MKRLAAFITLSALTLIAAAQYPAGMSDAAMQNMMQGIQEMLSCMAGIDQAEIQRLGKEGEQMYAELKALCDEGKRDEAQAKAMEYGMKIAKDPTLQAVAECGKQAQSMMPQTPGIPTLEELQNRHVCDAP